MNGLLLPRDFVRESLELHLYFGRIMKEHSIFLEAGFLAKDADLAHQADMLKLQFAEVLQEAVILANGVVNEEFLKSGEALTDKTLRAEQLSEELSCISMQSVITIEELQLCSNAEINQSVLEAQVTALNQKAIGLTNVLVQFKTNVLEGMLQSKLFTSISLY